MSKIEFVAVRLNTASDDEEGRLIMCDGRLVGILARLDAKEQAPLRGYWSLEAGLGPLAEFKPKPFKDLGAACDWAEKRCDLRQSSKFPNDSFHS